MVRVVHRVVELVVDLGKPESGKWSANLRKLRFLFFARTQQRFGEAWKNYLQIYTNFYVCLLPVRNRDLGKPMKWKLIQCLLANPIRICQKGVKHRAKYQLRLQSNIHQITKNCFNVRSLYKHNPYILFRHIVVLSKSISLQFQFLNISAFIYENIFNMVTRDHRIEFRVYWEWHCNPGALHLVVNNVLYGGRSLWIDTSQRIWHCTNIFSCFTTQPWKYYGRDTTFTSTLALCSILTLLTLIGYDYWLFCCKKKNSRGILCNVETLVYREHRVLYRL